MYNSDYFKNINLSAIESSIAEIINDATSLETTNTEIRNKISGSTDWVSNAKATLDKGLYKIEWRLDILKKKLSTLKEAIDIAKIVVEYQESLKKETDTTKQKQLANKINLQINKFKAKILQIRVYSGSKDNSYSGSIRRIDYRSDTFEVNTTNINSLKTSINTYSDTISSKFNKFSSLETKVIEDEYLYYAYGLACKTYDKIMAKKDIINNWINNYCTNLESIENILPEQVYYAELSATVTNVRSSYPAKPLFENYQKTHSSYVKSGSNNKTGETDTKKTDTKIDTKNDKKPTTNNNPSNNTSPKNDKSENTNYNKIVNELKNAGLSEEKAKSYANQLLEKAGSNGDLNSYYDKIKSEIVKSGLTKDKASALINSLKNYTGSNNTNYNDLLNKYLKNGLSLKDAKNKATEELKNLLNK